MFHVERPGAGRQGHRGRIQGGDETLGGRLGHSGQQAGQTGLAGFAASTGLP